MSKSFIFSSREELDAALAEEVSATLREGIAARGSASLVVSGGSTPKGLFAALSATALSWEKVTVLLADERWVPESHDDSNSAMVKRLLLQGEAASAQWISFNAGSDDETSALTDLRATLEAMDTFDVVVLGMGGDSHTASLFPCSAELSEGLTTSETALMTQPTTAPHRRLSLSKRRLLDTRMGIVHIVGEDKLEVYRQATAKLDCDEHPISHFAERAPFALWFAP